MRATRLATRGAGAAGTEQQRGVGARGARGAGHGRGGGGGHGSRIARSSLVVRSSPVPQLFRQSLSIISSSPPPPPPPHTHTARPQTSGCTPRWSRSPRRSWPAMPTLPPTTPATRRKWTVSMAQNASGDRRRRHPCTRRSRQPRDPGAPAPHRRGGMYVFPLRARCVGQEGSLKTTPQCGRSIHRGIAM